MKCKMKGEKIIGIILILAITISLFPLLNLNAAGAQTLLFEDFEDQTANGWTVERGQWSIVNFGSSYKYDTQDEDNIARSYVGESSWSNYSVEVDLEVNSWGSASSMLVGVMGRYLDSDNYYMFVYDSGQLKIRKKVSGSIIDIASRNFTFSLNDTYTFRAELSGSNLKLYVNGAEQLSINDNTFSSGKAGLITCYANAKFDNVLIQTESQSPVLLFEDFEDQTANGWTVERGQWSIVNFSSSYKYDTQDEDNIARSYVGELSWSDYSVEVDLEVNSWGSTGSRLVGILGRYANADNYYMFVYDSGQLKIRKKVSGSITDIAAKNFTFVLNNTYVFKAVQKGSNLKLYVNDDEQLSINDNTFSSGKAGLVTCYANAKFDNVEICSLISETDPTPTPDPTSGPTPTTDPTPTPPPGGQTDTFGIKMLYPTKQGGDEWFMDMNNPAKDTSRFDPKTTITKNSDGSWKTKSDKVRMNVFIAKGYHPERIDTYNQALLAQKGYMQDPEDWKNVEMTGYVKVNSYSGDDNFAWYARGGRHYDGEMHEGTCYKGDLYYSGRTRFAKEQWHPSGYSYASNYNNRIPDLDDRWVGIKTIMYNFEKDGKTCVKLELWVDENQTKTSWTKINEYIDDGGWGDEAWPLSGNGGPPYADEDQIITWGGPTATFRWDSATNTDFKWFSVREIQPPQ